MKPADININLIESYFKLLKKLSPNHKLDLIAKLSESMKTTKTTENDLLQSLYGSFISEQSADELKKARTFNRKRASL